MPEDSIPAQPINPALPWREIWIDAITKPSVQTYERFIQQPSISGNTGYTWIFISTLIGYVISLLGQWAWSGLNPTNSALSPFANNPTVFYLLLVVCGAPIGASLSVLGLAISAGISQWVARMLGGVGSHSELVYAQAAFLAPLTLVIDILGIIPFVSCLIFPLFIYMVVLNVISIKAVNRFGWGKAIASSVIIWVAALWLVAVFVIVILALLGPSIGHVFSNIIQEIGTPTP